MKKLFKKSIATLIAALMVISAMPFTAITAEAATITGALSQNGYQIFTPGTESRWGSSQFNIVNDQQANNTSVGVIRFDISAIKGYTVNSATLNYKIDSTLGDYQGLTFYWSTDFSKIDSYIANGEKQSFDMSYGSGTTANESAASKLGFTTSQVLGTVAKSNTSTSASTIDIKTGFQNALNANASTLYLIIMQSTAGGSGSTDDWSDTKVTPTNFSVSYDVDITIPDYDGEILGVVDYDPVIYTHGSDYLSTGDNIADASETNEKQTKYSVKSGYTVESVFVENSACSITASNGKLTGTLNGTSTTPKVVSLVTIVKESETNKVYVQYDRLYAVSNPVPAHGLAGAYRWRTATLSTSYWDNIQFSMVGENSFPNYDGGSASSGTSQTAVGSMKKSGFTTALSLSFGDGVTTTDVFNTSGVKNAGRFAYEKSGSGTSAGTSTASVTTPEAHYYLDKSAPEDSNLNVNDDKYTFDISYIPQTTSQTNSRDGNTSVNIAITDFTQTNLTRTNLNQSNRAKNGGSKETITITGSVSNGSTSGSLTIQESATLVKASTTATIKLPFNITIFDKSSLRTVYKNCFNSVIKESRYTSSSWATYKSAMLNAEECLNKYDVSSVGDFETLLTNAYNNLQLALDMTAYNNAVTDSDTLKAKTDVYTQASLSEYTTAVGNAKKDSFSSQAEVDAATNAILSAKFLLIKKEIATKVIYVDENGSVIASKEEENYTTNYGDTLGLEAALETDEYVAKWTIKNLVDGAVTKLTTTASDIEFITNQDAEITVVVGKATKDEGTAYAKIVFTGKSGQTIAIKYAKIDEAYLTNQVAVPAVPFYTSNGWDKESVTPTKEGETIVVKATYTAAFTDNDKCTVYYTDSTNETVDYDTKITLATLTESGKQYALSTSTEEKDIITYLNDNVFYAPHCEKIYVLEVNKATDAKTAVIGSYIKTAGVADGKKCAVFNCMQYIPTDCKPQEWGVIVTVNGKSYTFKANSINSAGQFSYAITVPDSVTTMTVKSYAKYKTFDGQIKTVTSADYTQSL